MCDIDNLKQYFHLPPIDNLVELNLYDSQGNKYEYLMKNNQLDRGGFGTIFIAIKKDTREEVIIKIPIIRNDTTIENIMREVDISQHIHQIPQCKNKTIYNKFLFKSDVYLLDEQLKKDNIVIVSEPLGLDMFSIFLEILKNTPKHTKLTSIQINEFFMSVVCQLLEILICLYESKVVHCDLKLENMILNKDGNILLIDYGTARLEGKYEENTTLLRDIYKPPSSELCLNHKYDVYSIGKIIELLTYEINKKFAIDDKDKIDELISNMTCKLEDRYTIEEILSNTWVKDNFKFDYLKPAEPDSDKIKQIAIDYFKSLQENPDLMAQVLGETITNKYLGQNIY